MLRKMLHFEKWFQQVYVAEPSSDTISILGGLKERYESHKGRHLPDKAIDSCENVRVQLDSQPEEIDNLERKIMQLEI